MVSGVPYPAGILAYVGVCIEAPDGVAQGVGAEPEFRQFAGRGLAPPAVIAGVSVVRVVLDGAFVARSAFAECFVERRFAPGGVADVQYSLLVELQGSLQFGSAEPEFGGGGSHLFPAARVHATVLYAMEVFFGIELAGIAGTVVVLHGRGAPLCRIAVVACAVVLERVDFALDLGAANADSLFDAVEHGPLLCRAAGVCGIEQGSDLVELRGIAFALEVSDAREPPDARIAVDAPDFAAYDHGVERAAPARLAETEGVFGGGGEVPGSHLANVMLVLVGRFFPLVLVGAFADVVGERGGAPARGIAVVVRGVVPQDCRVHLADGARGAETEFLFVAARLAPCGAVAEVFYAVQFPYFPLVFVVAFGIRVVHGGEHPVVPVANVQRILVVVLFALVRVRARIVLGVGPVVSVTGEVRLLFGNEEIVGVGYAPAVGEFLVGIHDVGDFHAADGVVVI